MDWLTAPDAWLALVTLTSLEIVLGIDNIVFLTILVGRLPEHQRDRARRIGLALAMLLRIGLLLSIQWVMGLEATWFEVPLSFLDPGSREISARDLILIGGGLFLLTKSTLEIHHKLEPAPTHDAPTARAGSFSTTLVQIAVLDLVFSIDSVITAVGMAERIGVMVTAVVLAVVVMMLFAGAVGRFVERNPTFQMLALSFLVLIGVALLGEGLDLHIPKGYVYFAMGFSVLVELLNSRLRRNTAATTPDGPEERG